MKLIVGLGNPEKKYENTRHNIGFMIIDAFSKEKSITLKNKPNFKGEVFLNKDYILLKPTTYMNLSGQAVQAVASFYKIDSKDILVISDDFNLPFAKLRLREKGSSGGHNGLKSIIQSIGTDEFNRLRFGLGEIDHNAIDFVLTKFNSLELKQIAEKYEKTNSIIDMFIEGKPFDHIMNLFNVND